MRALIFALALALTGGLAQAADPPPPIRAFPIPTVEALGREMALHDAAAWVATDALRPRVADFAKAGLRGWIVVDAPGGKRVRFLRDVGNGLEAGYDIDVTPQLKTTVSEPTDRALSAEERAKFAARDTAAAALRGQPMCRPGYNYVVLKDPEADGWLVWFLAPMPELGAIPVGGHYRLSVSADGKTVTRRDALSASCMVMPKPDTAKGQPAAAVVSHVVSPTPVETHVFLQLQSRQGMFVLAGDRVWSIANGKIADQGAIKDLAAKAKTK